MKKKVLILLVISLVLLFNMNYVVEAKYNNYDTSMLTCGDGMLDNIPPVMPKAVSIVYKLVQIGIPIVLVIVGMIDFTKGIASAKEEDIKKNQKLFIKRLIAAGIIFFVFAIVKFFISIVTDSSDEKVKILDCAECFINNDCEEMEEGVG